MEHRISNIGLEFKVRSLTNGNRCLRWIIYQLAEIKVHLTEIDLTQAVTAFEPTTRQGLPQPSDSKDRGQRLRSRDSA